MRSLIVITFLFLLSCNSEPQNQEEPEAGVDMVDDKNADSNDAFSFPQLHDIGNCDGPPRAPELCEWGLAAHDIVLLEITETSRIVSPSVDTKTGMVVERCDREVSAGFRMEGVVQQSINGLSGQIVVDVGLFQYVDSWDPQPGPKPNEDGTMRWWPPGKIAIKSGDIIGLTLFKNPSDETFGILGEHFFDINAKKTIRFGELHSECGMPQPKNVSGLTFEKLKDEIKKCELSAMADARKQAKEVLWNAPTYSHLGTCTQ